MPRGPWLAGTSAKTCQSLFLPYIVDVERGQAINNQLAAVRDHTRNFKEFLYVYPVISRRSRGLSIGINLNPDKICNFNCIYCEVDRISPPRIKHVDTSRIRQELNEMVATIKAGGLLSMPRFQAASDLTHEIKDFAFSGDGEPTMVRDFDACVQVVADVKRENRLIDTKIVLITDAAGLDKESVQRGLKIMDANQGEIWAKLDAGTESYYKLVNRSNIQFERILGNLLQTALIRPITIQTMFLKVQGASMPQDEFQAYCQRLRHLLSQGAKIREVQAYTVARPTPEAYATRLTPEELEAFADGVRRETGLLVSVFP